MDPTTTQFSQHVSIAYFKVDDYAAAAARFEHRARLGAMRPTVTEEEIANDEEMLDGARHAQHAAQELWGEIWSQLDEARGSRTGWGVTRGSTTRPAPSRASTARARRSRSAHGRSRAAASTRGRTRTARDRPS